MEDFIRHQVRMILSEEGKETRSFGRTTERIKEFGNLAESNPGRVAQSFGFSDFSPSGDSNKEKVASFLRYLVNNDNDLMGIIRGIVVEGNDIKVLPRQFKYDEDKVYTARTGRIARYIGALLIAANGIGKLKFEKEKRNILHLTGEYVIVKSP